MSQTALLIDDGAPDSELWLPIVEAPGYDVSNRGRVRSWVPRNRNALAPTVPRPLKATLCKSTGYLRVHLHPKGRGRVPRAVHTLVASAFLGDAPPGMQARHQNGIGTDNDLGNLVWGTPAQNQADRVAHGTSNRGERHGMAKLTTADVVRIWTRVLAGEPDPSIAMDYNVSRSAIGFIRSGRTWSWLTSGLGGGGARG